MPPGNAANPHLATPARRPPPGGPDCSRTYPQPLTPTTHRREHPATPPAPHHQRTHGTAPPTPCATPRPTTRTHERPAPPTAPVLSSATTPAQLRTHHPAPLLNHPPVPPLTTEPTNNRAHAAIAHADAPPALPQNADGLEQTYSPTYDYDGARSSRLTGDSTEQAAVPA